MRASISISLLLIALGSCGEGEAPPERQYQRNANNQAEISCPSIRLATFSEAAKEFARRKGLEYRDRVDNGSGSAFIIAMQNKHQQILLSDSVSVALLSQHLESAAVLTEADRQLFNELVEVLDRCGSEQRQ